MLRGLGLTSLLLTTGWWIALPDPVQPDPESPRPIAAKDSVFTEDLTWMEIRDALRAGKETIIVATGGVEQNGPHEVSWNDQCDRRDVRTSFDGYLFFACVAWIQEYRSDR